MNAGTFILIIFMATSSYGKSGAAGISQEFGTEAACNLAGQSLAKDAHTRGNYVLTWGCFKKGQ